MQFKEWLKLNEDFQIRGEYWVVGGSVTGADGDTGDYNHDGVAYESTYGQHRPEVVELALQLKIEMSPRFAHDEPLDTSEFEGIVDSIIEQMGRDEAMKALNVDLETLTILSGGGDISFYVMKREGWIAVRGNNAELFGFDNQKRKSLAYGLGEIVEQESGGEELPDEEIEISIHDRRSNRSFDLTLADLNAPQMAARSQQMPTTKGHSQFHITPNDSENMTTPKKPLFPGLAGDYWRGTSE